MITNMISSLKRLYSTNRITSQKLTGLKTKGVLTQNEYDYITGKINEEAYIKTLGA